MKKIIIAILILGSLPCLTFAQDNIEGDTLIPMEVQRQIFVYGAAKKYNDKMMQLSTLCGTSGSGHAEEPRGANLLGIQRWRVGVTAGRWLAKSGFKL